MMLFRLLSLWINEIQRICWPKTVATIQQLVAVLVRFDSVWFFGYFRGGFWVGFVGVFPRGFPGGWWWVVFCEGFGTRPRRFLFAFAFCQPWQRRQLRHLRLHIDTSVCVCISRGEGGSHPSVYRVYGLVCLWALIKLPIIRCNKVESFWSVSRFRRYLGLLKTSSSIPFPFSFYHFPPTESPTQKFPISPFPLPVVPESSAYQKRTNGYATLAVRNAFGIWKNPFRCIYIYMWLLPIYISLCVCGRSFLRKFRRLRCETSRSTSGN